MTTSEPHPILDKLSQISQLLHYSLRPLPPRFGDGRYDSDVDPAVVKAGLLKDLGSQALRIPADIELVSEAISTVFFQGGLQDDKKYFMEKIIQFVASLPESSKLQGALTSALIGNLWNILKHPPLSYVGDKYEYRQADGSYNNIMYPHLGKAGTEYAKTVKPTYMEYAAMPDPSLLFDGIPHGSANLVLLARKEYKPHPNRISSMLFYFATIIIHDLFKTSHEDPNISLTSSYLDLAPLYGSSQKEQDSIRTFIDGKLKPDCFCEERVLGFPPGVSVFLVCFNRFHNYMVGEIAAINEGGRFTVPTIASIERKMPGADPAKIKAALEKAVAKRDNDLFQTARLVTCGLYINIVLNDYVRTILGLNRVADGWNLDPRVDGPNVYTSSGVPEGVGNQVSLEFNLLYRWHATVSDRDDKWTQEFAKTVFPGQNISTMTTADFLKGLAVWTAGINADPSKRDLDMGKLKRRADGTFDDAALMRTLTESTEDCAAAFDSGIPVVLRLVEVLGIQQSRYWKTATLNEFRKYFGLLPHKTFEDVNPEKAVLLRQMYDHPDNLELYPGLIVESPKKPMAPGSGLCPPQTIGKAILSDAVALVRGDRFYTVDYSPANLTHFGYTFVQPDINVAQGGLMFKLLMRAFPGWYEYNSVYAMFPFTIPSENKKLFEDMKVESEYSFKRPSPPQNPIVFSTAKNAMRILGDQKTFKVIWGDAISRLTGGVEYMLSGDLPSNTKQHNQVVAAVSTEVSDGMKEVWDFYAKRMEKLLAERSYPLGNSILQVDAARDIANMVHTEFASRLFNLPLKDEEHPLHPFTEKQMYDILGLLFGYVFLDRDEAMSWQIRTLGKQACDGLATLVMFNIKEVARGGILKKFADDIEKDGFLDKYGNAFIRRLLDMKMSMEEILWIIMPTAAAGTANQGQQSIQILDLYLSDKYQHHWQEIVRLAQQPDNETTRKKLRGYVWEGIRLAPQSYGLFRKVAEKCSIEENGKTYDLKPGDEIFVNLVGANLDPAVFPNPLEVNPNRPESSYVAFGWGPHRCIGQEIDLVANTAILRAFARLPNLRRAPGPQGEIKYVMKQEVVKVYLQEDWSSYWFFPTTMKVHFDKMK